MNRNGIIFDLDGTLWNTTETIVPVWNKVLVSHKETKKQLTVDEMNGYMGKTLEEIAAIMLPLLPLEKAVCIIKECCKAESAYLEKAGGKLYDGLEDTLEKLKEKYMLFIVSNCQNGYLQAFLNHHRLSNYFDDYEMSGRTGLTKGENIRIVMERNNLDKAVYVGDTEGDFSAAKQAGVSFIYAQYGFGKVKNADYVINKLPELVIKAKKIFGF